MFQLGLVLLCTTFGVFVHTAPPSSWQEHWFEHNQNVQLKFKDNDIAIYFDKDVRTSVTWPFQYLGDVWRYTKKVYGSFGQEPTLYAIFHAGKYAGGHPSTYFDSGHDYRNVIDCGTGDLNGWTSGQGNDLDIVTHEVAHIVESASKNVHNSPAFNIWGDSKWAEIFIYDVYLGLGRTADANRWYNICINARDNYPQANTAWFKNWFYPIYSKYGKSAVLNNYFTLLSQYFPRNGQNYSRNLNLGEFVHFWSGAARTNLQSLAATAFGWTSTYDIQLQNAKRDFPSITYY